MSVSYIKSNLKISVGVSEHLRALAPGLTREPPLYMLFRDKRIPYCHMATFNKL